VDKQEPRNILWPSASRTGKLSFWRESSPSGQAKITLATKRALEERLRRTGAEAHKAALFEDLEAIRRRLAALPVLDDRTPDEIIGYDENGIPS
jgi:antitoxin VapB